MKTQAKTTKCPREKRGFLHENAPIARMIDRNRAGFLAENQCCPKKIGPLRRSLRDIEACLRAQPSKLYHMGLRGGVSRNTLAHTNAALHQRLHYLIQYFLRRAHFRLRKRGQRSSITFNRSMKFGRLGST